MAMDLKKVMEQASAAISGGRNTFSYPLLYPGVGSTKVKLLHNIKAGVTMRLITRHPIPYRDNKGQQRRRNVPCMRTWGRDQECPICRALENIKNATGAELGFSRAITRGIAFAQFISSTAPLPQPMNGGAGIQPNSVVLFMFPWTVYEGISNIIAQAGNDMDKIRELVAINEGRAFDIIHSSDNKYNVNLDIYGMYRTCGAEKDFEQFLTNLENLNDQILPAAGPTEEMIHQIMNTAKELEATYIKTSPTAPASGMSPMGYAQQYQAVAPQQPQFQPQPQPQFQPQVQAPVAPPQPQPQVVAPTSQPIIPTETPMASVPPMATPPAAPVAPAPAPATAAPAAAPAVPANAGQPPCFGGYHKEKDPETCAMCSVELLCAKASGASVTDADIPF